MKTLRNWLATEPHQFNFFQAVRLLERRDPADAPAEPLRAVGEDDAPRDEPVRFEVQPSLTFPPGEIRSFAESEDAAPPRMSVAFFGLLGPAGVLPRHYNQLAIERSRAKDHSLRDFLNIFQHRLIALFYRAWRKFRFYVGYERAVDAGRVGEDEFTQMLYALVGLGTEALRGRELVDDQTWLYYAGQLAHAPRNAHSLTALTADFLEVPVETKEFVGQWLYLTPSDQTRLTGSFSRASANNRLGVDAVAGDRVWGSEQKFRLRLGPLGYPQFLRFLPSGEHLTRTCQFVRNYAGPEFDFEIQPVLRREEVPAARLGGAGEPTRLGWNSWCLSEPAPTDAADAIFVDEGWGA